MGDSRSLPAEARGEDGAWRLRMRARHRVQVPKSRPLVNNYGIWTRWPVNHSKFAPI